MTWDEVADEFFPPEREVLRLAPGIYEDVSHDDYHADPGERPTLSSSIARLLVDESPEDAYCEHPRLGRHSRLPSRDMDRGTLIHLLLLGKGQMFQEIEAASYQKQWAQQAKKDAIADGKVPVLSRELEEYRYVAQIFKTKLKRHLDHDGNPDPIVLDGKSEVTVIVEIGGVLCRMRLDHWKEDTLEIFDVKTTLKSVAPHKLIREMYSNGNDIQHAAYTEGVGKLTDNVGRIRMRFLFLQVRPPYGVVVLELAGTLVECGERRWKRARGIWQPCLDAHLKAGNDEEAIALAWPGHGNNRTVRVSAEQWMLKADGDAEMYGMPSGDPPPF